MKPLIWIASMLEQLREFPGPVQQDIGYALELVQKGEKYPRAKPLKGFRGASILEIVADFDGDTWRAVYTVKFPKTIHVLRSRRSRSPESRRPSEKST